MRVHRRSLLAGGIGLLAETALGKADSILDGAGRQLVRPDHVQRVFPAGPPAAILIYTLAPDLLLGWPRANRTEEREFLLPEIGSRPEIVRITGRGNSANLEAVLAAKPDLIIDVGSTAPTYVSLADRVQSQTGIPYALLDGTLARTPETYRTLGRLLGREREAGEKAAYAERLISRTAQRVAGLGPDTRPRVYYARGPRGLETGRGGSINVESLDLLSAVNVAGDMGGGLATVSVEQILSWDPDVIVTIDRDFAASVRQDPAWASIKAVRDGRIHLSPKLPFG